MKNEMGFTLIELMVVTVIVGMLLAVATLYFGRLSQKYEIESTIKEVYAVVMKARNNASSTNSPHVVQFAANQVRAGVDADNDGAIDNAADIVNITFGLIFPVNPLIFDRRGITTNMQTIRATGYSPSVTPSVDCIVIGNTRINIGRWEGGAVNDCIQQ